MKNIGADNDGNIIRNFADDNKKIQDFSVLIENYKSTQKLIDSLYKGSMQ